MKTIHAVKEFGEIKPEWVTDHLDEKVNKARRDTANSRRHSGLQERSAEERLLHRQRREQPLPTYFR
jgi:hypothetical protein